MVVLFLVRVRQSSLSQLAKTVLSPLLAPLSQHFVMPLVNQLSYISAKAMSASVSPLPNGSQAFATRFLLERPSRCRLDLQLRY
jgi:hypothetical protein